ncbi:DsbA family protein [bacterium]|nr:DsbA family protein [bacterium]
MKTVNQPFLKFLVLVFITLNFTIACASSDTQTQKSETATAQGSLSTEQAEKIGAYVRKAFGVPANVGVVVKEGGDQKIPGLTSIQVQFVTDKGSQVQDAWVSSDQKIMVIGRVLDLTIDLDKQRMEKAKENLSKMNLQNSPSKGAPAAKVTIVEYTDFQCPFCSRGYTTIEQLLKDYDGKVKVVYKALPLNIHNWAEDSAVAAACVAEQNKDAFWKYYSFFFQNQKTIQKDTLNGKVMSMAKENGLDEAALKTCIDTKKTLPQIQADVKEAQTLGFNSTPSFMVNGNPVIGAKPIEEFKQIIDAELAASK